MSVENDCVVYVNFKSFSEEECAENEQMEYYETSLTSSIITIEEYERRKTIDELVERADNLIW